MMSDMVAGLQASVYGYRLYRSGPVTRIDPSPTYKDLRVFPILVEITFIRECKPPVGEYLSPDYMKCMPPLPYSLLKK